MVKFDKIRFEVSYSTDTMRERKEIETSLSYYNPQSVFNKNEYWDGFVRYYNKRQRTFNFGHLSTVINHLIKKNIDYQINNVDVEIFKPSIPYTKILHIHQLAALHSFFQTKHGIIKVPTRGGKTFIASEAIRLILNSNKKYKVLFVVDSQLLFNQAINDISEFLKIKSSDIGIIKEEIFDIKQITIAMVQTMGSILNGVKRLKNRSKFVEPIEGKKSRKTLTLSELKIKRKEKRLNINTLIQYLSEVKFLIVDECHEYSSDDRINLVKKVYDAEFYMFLSASPFKSENMFANLSNKGICGDILYEIPEQILKERGVLARDKILLININHNDNPNIDFDKLGKNYRDFVDKVIVSNQQRNQIVVNMCEICRKIGLKTLGLFMFKKHGYNVSKITGDPFITGVNDLDEREFVKNNFLKNKGGVLLASDIFKKGITLPDVEVMINIGGGKEQSGLVQKKGRVLGTTKNKKKALIIDFIDESKYFGEHSLKRIEVYEESVGIENIVIMDSDDEDFYPQCRDFIKQWFEK